MIFKGKPLGFLSFLYFIIAEENDSSSNVVKFCYIIRCTLIQLLLKISMCPYEILAHPIPSGETR